MSTNANQKNAVIYARVSSDEQVQGYSIQAQIRACREWAAKNGFKVVKEYLDEGYSASRHLDKREAFKDMIAEGVSKTRSFDLVIVHKLDRFSRDSAESFTTRALLKRHKVRLVSVQEPAVGSDAPEDAFMEHILMGMAEFYSRNLSREIMKGMSQRAHEGHLVFRPPFGYRREVIERQEGPKRTRTISKPVVDEKTAPIVKRIFELFDKGVGYKTIATTLNQDGYRSGQRTPFRVYNISQILRNKAYIGDLTYNARQDRGAREPFTISGFYPMIIERDLFDRVQKKLEGVHSSWHNSYAQRTNYLLSRLVICDHCSHHYVGTAAKGGRFHYYSCQTYLQKGKRACNAPLLNKNKLENAVLDQIYERVLSTENVHRYLELAMAATARKPERTVEESATEAAIKDADAKLHRWEEALECGLLSLEDAAQRIKALRQERATLLNTQSKLEQRSRSRAEIRPIPTALMDNYIKEIQKRLKEKAIFSKREFLMEIVKEVRVRGKEITLTYRLPWAPAIVSEKDEGGRFFTVSKMVVAVGLEPTTSRM
jgi:site-specific DNA recombinase